jgi:hypothetical protein
METYREKLERAIYNRLKDIFNREREMVKLDDFLDAFEDDKSLEVERSVEVTEDEFFGRVE